ncbi:MAG: DUF2461 domain-containing protein [Actinomycetota bacterium]
MPATSKTTKPYFTPELFGFLSELKEHNDRDWFAKNRERYERVVREPFLDFIQDVGPRRAKISPHLVADPRPVGGSLFRIHRDVRFSKDKSPYKTYAGAHFRHSTGKDVHAPGVYLHLQPEECFVGGGMWQPDPPALTAIRRAIDEQPAAWRKARRTTLMGGETLKRPPQGYPPDHAFIEDLKRKSFVTSAPLEDQQLSEPSFMTTFLSACRSMQPFLKFLATAVGLPW